VRSILQINANDRISFQSLMPQLMSASTSSGKPSFHMSDRLWFSRTITVLWGKPVTNTNILRSGRQFQRNPSLYYYLCTSCFKKI